jgi:hypothetical protein
MTAIRLFAGRCTFDFLNSSRLERKEQFSRDFKKGNHGSVSSTTAVAKYGSWRRVRSSAGSIRGFSAEV